METEMTSCNYRADFQILLSTKKRNLAQTKVVVMMRLELIIRSEQPNQVGFLLGIESEFEPQYSNRKILTVKSLKRHEIHKNFRFLHIFNKVYGRMQNKLKMITIPTYKDIQTCRIYLPVIILSDDIKGVYLGTREITSMVRFTTWLIIH